MKSSSLYLVSQHFGRVTAAVYRDACSCGTVELSVEHVGLIMQLKFTSESAARLSSNPVLLDEELTRHAVAQAHRLRGRVMTVPECRFELDIRNRPWIGDFLAAPYGGATNGFEAGGRLHVTEMHRGDRRIDHSTYQIVERAVYVQRYSGHRAATAIMIDHAIAQHVMLRVFSGAAFRRKE